MDRAHQEWTCSRGLLRGFMAGGLVGIGLLGLSAALAWYAPLVAANGWIRVGASLLTTFLLFSIIHRAAGMTGPVCTGMVVGWIVLIVLAQHVVFAIHGVPTRSGVVAGWVWCSAGALAVCNIFTAIGTAFGVYLWHDGASLSSLTDILRLKHRM